MSEDTTTNGGGVDASESTEALRIKAEHRQTIAALDREHEQKLAELDAKSFERMPIALRILFDERLYNRVTRVAETMAKAQGFTPPHLIGKTESCFAVVSKALTWNLDPFSVAQATYDVHGKTAMEGRLCQAIIEASGRLAKPIGQGEYFGEWSRISGKFRVEGNKAVPTWTYWGPEEEGLGVRYKVYLVGADEPIPFEFMLRSAFPRNATTWPTRTKQQLHYAAMRALGSVVCPSLIMGVPWAEDGEPAPAMKEINPQGESRAELRRKAMQAVDEVRMVDCVSADGETVLLLPGEVEPFLLGELASTTSLDEFVEANRLHIEASAKLREAVEKRQPVATKEAVTEPDDEFDNSEPEPIGWITEERGEPQYHLRGGKVFSYQLPFAKALAAKLVGLQDEAEIEAAERDLATLLPQLGEDAKAQIQAAMVPA